MWIMFWSFVALAGAYIVIYLYDTFTLQKMKDKILKDVELMLYKDGYNKELIEKSIVVLKNTLNNYL